LGGFEEPKIKLDDLLNHYVSNAKGKTLNKSENQVRKWLNPRKLAMKTLVQVVGNKPAKDFTREDMVKYRDWWLDRIEQEEVGPATANKNLITVATIIKSVNKSLQLKLEKDHIFEEMLLPEDDKTRRLPFTTDFLRDVLLQPKTLSGLNAQARWMLHAMAETGAGVSELVGILPEEIFLDHDIPHIIIAPRKKKSLKNKYRKRLIPLVGHALDAFKSLPEGFTDYRDRPDSLSTHLSKFLRENNILPSNNHSVYSLRHSFQDRLLAANAPDRVQADLMGHKFDRPYYGDGCSLVHKREWLWKIQLKKG
jgi:integrase